MRTSESKVILNYDNVRNLENRYPDAVIRPYDPGPSKAKEYMADTVFMRRRYGMSREQMAKLAKDAAPLATRLIIEGCADNPSHDNKAGIFPVFATHPVYAMQ